jgi:predicted dehydrogenase
MSESNLRAVVIGAGNAGRGQIAALEHCDVEVVGVASRTTGSARRVARDLGIPHHATDWRECLETLRPDIVGVATPGDQHAEIVLAALELGAHVVCERPLALEPIQARELSLRARELGRKSCLCAPALFQPQLLFVRELLAEGVIGRLRDIECVSNFNWPRYSPLNWQHQLELGGGRLNHFFANSLAAIHAVVDRPVLSAVGEARTDWGQVPRYDPEIDWSEFYHRNPTEEELAGFEWVDVDADTSYSAVVRFGDADTEDGETVDGEAGGETVSALFRHSALNNSWVNDYTAFHGDRGSIHIQGAQFQGSVLVFEGGPTWEERAIPLEIVDALPVEANNDRRNWMTLMAQFVADIRGEEEFAPYPTFEEGALYQAIIAAVRQGEAWQAGEG